MDQRDEQSALILPFDSATARETARLIKGKSPNLFVDAVIAATARTYGLIVATSKTAGFIHFEAEQVDPFLYPRS